jgi:16S rRNA (guanine527-N7)-methyltransferase
VKRSRGELPEISAEEFADRLRAYAPDLPPAAVAALHLHYRELRRWNARLSLIGPGTAHEVVERHYGDSLAALPLLDSLAAELLDVGSGAGFPGLVLAVARPALRVTLLESRERKAAFLARSAQLVDARVRVVEGFLGRSLPNGVPERLDFVTLRAVRLEAGWEVLRQRLSPGGRLLQWSGPESPAPPATFEQIAEVRVRWGERRSIRVYTVASGANDRERDA